MGRLTQTKLRVRLQYSRDKALSYLARHKDNISEDNIVELNGIRANGARDCNSVSCRPSPWVQLHAPSSVLSICKRLIGIRAKFKRY